MPPLDFAREQQQTKQQQDAAFEWYFDGRSDAQRGDLPQYQQEDYLRGYIDEIKSLPVDLESRVVYPNLRGGFAWGYVDCAENFAEPIQEF